MRFSSNKPHARIGNTYMFCWPFKTGKITIYTKTNHQDIHLHFAQSHLREARHGLCEDSNETFRHFVCEILAILCERSRALEAGLLLLLPLFDVLLIAC
jgi:hypothetical protein